MDRQTNRQQRQGFYARVSIVNIQVEKVLIYNNKYYNYQTEKIVIILMEIKKFKKELSPVFS